MAAYTCNVLINIGGEKQRRNMLLKTIVLIHLSINNADN